MPRYLLFLSYIGTNFRGVQKEIVKADPGLLDPLSIQGILEIALQRFRPINKLEVFASSRTDRGVHALRTSVHVDIEHSSSHIKPDFLVLGLNRYFERAGADLRILSCQIVPESFHARHSAKSRTYLYRLAVRVEGLPTFPKNKRYLLNLPITEWKRCYFIHDPEFDVTQFKLASQLFVGIHDFRTFMGSAAHQWDGIRTIRQVNQLSIEPGKPMLTAEYSPSVSDYHFWDVIFNSPSFLYRQVRRTVGVLIAVAQGRLSVDKVRWMLDNPSSESWDSRAVTAPPHGLYLVNVEYDPEDLLLNQTPVKSDTTTTDPSKSKHHIYSSVPCKEE